MNQTKNNSNIITAVVLVLLASVTRFIPNHPFNFTAIGAMALFSGANFSNKKYAFLLPVAAMFITDIFIGLHSSIIPVYACFAFTVWMGMRISNNQSIRTVITASLLSSIVFFLVTNLPFWYIDIKLYPMTWSGTMESYWMARPFFRNQVLGDLFYNGVLFGVFHLAAKKYRLTPIKTTRKE